MEGSAVTMARRIQAQSEHWDALLISGLFNVASFRGLLRKPFTECPVGLYFHENQLTYPWSLTDPDPGMQRDHHYMFINYTSALAADAVYFNSQYHLRSFIDALPGFLGRFPDHIHLDTIEQIEAKSTVMLPGIDWPAHDTSGVIQRHEQPVILWNHRWEYDKNPELFFNTLFRLSHEGIPFRLIVAGEQTSQYPAIFDEARNKLISHIIHFGYIPGKTQYETWLRQADIIAVTAIQDFFGLSVNEAIAAGCIPLLPNRLAYPEHVSASEYPQLFYTEDEEFYPALKNLLSSCRQIDRKPLQASVQRYSWPMLTPMYQQALERLGRQKTIPPC